LLNPRIGESVPAESWEVRNSNNNSRKVTANRPYIIIKNKTDKI
jgi:hypothetical protein